MRPLPSFALGFAALAAASAQTPSQPSRELDVIAAEIPRDETGFESDHATGNWGGLRDRLVDRGVHLYAGYAAEVMGSVSGGIDCGAVVDGLLELGLDLDTAKLGLWPGGLVRVTSLYPHGASLSGKYTGDILTASNIDAYDSFRLYELWCEQLLFEDRLALRAGQLVADDEFAFTDAGSGFLNSAFGWPAFISANVLNTGPAFYVATPGLRLRFDASESLYFQAGLYDGDSFDSADGDPRVNRSGTHIHLSSEQGAFAIAEAGLRWNSSKSSSASALPGIVKLGAWLHTADFASHFHDESGGELALTGLDPEIHSHSFGAYLALEQMIWREVPGEDQGLSFFARAGAAPRDRAFFEFVADVGLAVTGLVPGRDQDTLGLGFVHARISRDLRAFEQLDASANGASYAAFSDHESVLEAFYSFQPARWWTIQPDIQWIIHPGGSGAIPDALVLGLRTSIVF